MIFKAVSTPHNHIIDQSSHFTGKSEVVHGRGVGVRQRAYGLLVVLIDGEAGELLEVEVVLARRHVADAAHQRPGVVGHGLLLRAAGGRYGEGEQHEQGQGSYE